MKYKKQMDNLILLIAILSALHSIFVGSNKKVVITISFLCLVYIFISSKMSFYKKNIVAIAGLLGLLLFLSQLFPIGRVVSASMYPAQKVHDLTISSRFYYHFHEIQQGDMITFLRDEDKTLLGKRVIGTSGDCIEIVDGNVYVNDTKLNESDYLDEDIYTFSNKEKFEVPENCLFVLGDNRFNSYDSRFWDNPYIDIDTSSICKVIFVVPIGSIFEYLESRGL